MTHHHSVFDLASKIKKSKLSLMMKRRHEIEKQDPNYDHRQMFKLLLWFRFVVLRPRLLSEVTAHEPTTKWVRYMLVQRILNTILATRSTRCGLKKNAILLIPARDVVEMWEVLKLLWMTKLTGRFLLALRKNISCLESPSPSKSFVAQYLRSSNWLLYVENVFPWQPDQIVINGESRFLP